MNKRLVALLTIVAGGVACAPVVAHADFSACASAFEAKDPQQQIALYTSCLKHGGLASTDVAGAFNNRGAIYAGLGDAGHALQDYTSAIQYYPGWALPYANRARVEAPRGLCAQAQGDISKALKLEPHNKQMLEEKARIEASCPSISKPTN